MPKFSLEYLRKISPFSSKKGKKGKMPKFSLRYFRAISSFSSKEDEVSFLKKKLSLYKPLLYDPFKEEFTPRMAYALEKTIRLLAPLKKLVAQTLLSSDFREVIPAGWWYLVERLSGEQLEEKRLSFQAQYIRRRVEDAQEPRHELFALRDDFEHYLDFLRSYDSSQVNQRLDQLERLIEWIIYPHENFLDAFIPKRHSRLAPLHQKYQAVPFSKVSDLALKWFRLYDACIWDVFLGELFVLLLERVNVEYNDQMSSSILDIFWELSSFVQQSFPSRWISLLRQDWDVPSRDWRTGSSLSEKHFFQNYVASLRVHFGETYQDLFDRFVDVPSMSSSLGHTEVLASNFLSPYQIEDLLRSRGIFLDTLLFLKPLGLMKAYYLSGPFRDLLNCLSEAEVLFKEGDFKVLWKNYTEEGEKAYGLFEQFEYNILTHPEKGLPSLRWEIEALPMQRDESYWKGVEALQPQMRALNSSIQAFLFDQHALWQKIYLIMESLVEKTFLKETLFIKSQEPPKEWVQRFLFTKKHLLNVTTALEHVLPKEL